jgi:hypothetical protein
MRVVDLLVFDRGIGRRKTAVNAEKRGCILIDTMVEEEWWRSLVRVARLNLPFLTIGLAIVRLLAQMLRAISTNATNGDVQSLN